MPVAPGGRTDVVVGVGNWSQAAGSRTWSEGLRAGGCGCVWSVRGRGGCRRSRAEVVEAGSRGRDPGKSTARIRRGGSSQAPGQVQPLPDPPRSTSGRPLLSLQPSVNIRLTARPCASRKMRPRERRVLGTDWSRIGHERRRRGWPRFPRITSRVPLTCTGWSGSALSWPHESGRRGHRYESPTGGQERLALVFVSG